LVESAFIQGLHKIISNHVQSMPNLNLAGMVTAAENYWGVHHGQEIHQDVRAQLHQYPRTTYDLRQPHQTPGRLEIP